MNCENSSASSEDSVVPVGTVSRKIMIDSEATQRANRGRGLRYTISIATNAALGKKTSEDRVGFSGRFFWVLDGASLPKVLESKSPIDTVWYVDALHTQIEAVVRRNPDVQLQSLLEQAIAGVVEETRKLGVGVADEALVSSTVSIARLNEDSVDCLVLGDSPILICAGGRVVHLFDERLGLVTDRYRQAVDGFDGDDLGRVALVLHQIEHRNKEGGYWVASFDPSAAWKANLGKYALTGDWKILLLTDGYSALVDTWGRFQNWGALAEYVSMNGLRRGIGEVRRLESEARGAVRSDDATALLLESEG